MNSEKVGFPYLDTLFSQKLRVAILRGVEADARVQVFILDRWQMWSPGADASRLHQMLADNGLASALACGVQLKCPFLLSWVVCSRPDLCRQHDVEAKRLSILLQVLCHLGPGETMRALQLPFVVCRTDCRQLGTEKGERSWEN